MKVADAISHILEAEGVALAAGITGQSVGHVADALTSIPDVRICYVRQERVAVDICDGYARVSGKPGVMFTDAGPAAANAMGGIVNSYGDSTPVLFLVGMINRFEAPRHYYKELRVEDVFSSVTKWATTIEDPTQVESVMRRAFVALKSGRAGPVVIGVPYDVSSMDCPTPRYRPIPAAGMRSAGDPSAIETAARLLVSAERPYVYVGAGVLFAGASPELLELAELLTTPVATTLNGKSAFPEDHPLSLGIGGFARATYGTLHATRCAEQADVVLTVGCGFKSHATRRPMPAGVKHIQIDLDETELHKESGADVAILGDARLVLRQLLAAVRSIAPADRLEARRAVLDEVARNRAEWLAVCEPLLTSEEQPINPFRVTWELAQAVNPAETIVLHDAGSVRGSTCQHYPAVRPRSFLGYGVASAMGWTIGAGIGAKLAAPDKLVVSVLGDEAFAETAMDLETAVRTQVPILLIMKNNKGFVDRDGGLSPRLADIRFRQVADHSALARAMGVDAVRVEDPASLRPALDHAIQQVRSGRIAMVEVVTRRVPTSLYRLWEQPAAQPQPALANA